MAGSLGLGLVACSAIHYLHARCARVLVQRSIVDVESDIIIAIEELGCHKGDSTEAHSIPNPSFAVMVKQQLQTVASASAPRCRASYRKAGCRVREEHVHADHTSL